MGVLRLEGVDIEVFALPLDPSLRPIYGVLLASAPVAVTLSASLATDVVELLGVFDVRVVEATAGWDRPDGAAQLLREALAHSSRPATGAP